MSNSLGDGSIGDGSYAFRLRFRSAKGLSSTEEFISFKTGGVLLTIRREGDAPLQEAGWFLIRGGGFSSEDEARAYGEKLVTALQLSSLRRLWGVDVGEGKPTSALGKSIVDSLAADGHFARANIHGLDVYLEQPNTFWTAFTATGRVSLRPDYLLDDITRIFTAIPDDASELYAVWLLNEALVSKDAPAQLVLAIAAVESLANGEDWSAVQRTALERLAVTAEKDSSMSGEERSEIASAIRRGIHRMSIRQGQKRLLKSLELEKYWRVWDEIYTRRSEMLHGLTYATPSERSKMISPAIHLSARIVLSAVERIIPGSAEGLDNILPVPSSAFEM